MDFTVSGRQAGRRIEFMNYNSNGPSFANSGQIQQDNSRRNGLGTSGSYEENARSLRKLRDDDVDMEDASDWPTSWDEEVPEVRNEKMDAAGALDSHEHALRLAEEQIVYIALDTNIFISHLTTVQAIHTQLSKVSQHTTNGPTSGGAATIRILVPNIVIHELDKQKTVRSEPIPPPQASSRRSLQASHHAKASPGSSGSSKSTPALASAARTAIEWLLRIRQAQRRGGIGQTSGELWIFQKKGEVFENDAILSKADDRILDCCEYFKNDMHVFGKKKNVVLWTDDKNLGLQVRVQQLPIVSYADDIEHLQAEIHDIPHIGNQSFSAEQVIGAAQDVYRARSDTNMGTATDTPRSWKSSPLRPANPVSPHAPHTQQKRPHAANASKDFKSHGRGITSSIWANSSPAARKSKVSGQHDKARAKSLPLLTSPPTARPKTHQAGYRLASSPPTPRDSPKSTAPPRLADAIALMQNSTPSPSNVNTALGHIIAFPLYDLLLAEVSRGQPTLLRQFLGAADPGPAHWTGADSMQLLLRGWRYGLQHTYASHPAPSSPPSPETCLEAASWLSAFLTNVVTAELQRQGDAPLNWDSTSQCTSVARALRLLLVRYTPQWWLPIQNVQVVDQLIAWVLSA